MGQWQGNAMDVQNLHGVTPPHCEGIKVENWQYVLDVYGEHWGVLPQVEYFNPRGGKDGLPR